MSDTETTPLSKELLVAQISALQTACATYRAETVKLREDLTAYLRAEDGSEIIIEEMAAEITRLRAENAKLREALKRTNHHLAKLVNGGGKDDDGKPIPSVWAAARQQVLGARAALNEGRGE